MSYRSDFEVACLFHPTVGANLKRRGDGTFVDAKTEAAYLGYEMARKGDHEQLKRFDASRSIVQGHINQINGEMKKLGHLRDVTPDVVRAVLRVMGGSPV
jgi:hypothetical protein